MVKPPSPQNDNKHHINDFDPMDYNVKPPASARKSNALKPDSLTVVLPEVPDDIAK